MTDTRSVLPHWDLAPEGSDRRIFTTGRKALIRRGVMGSSLALWPVVLSLTVADGSTYTFGRDVNLLWKHGILAVIKWLID